MTTTKTVRLLICQLLLAAFLGGVNSASAATLMQAMLGGQVQQFTESGKVNGCGVTLFGVEQPQVGRVLVFNGSVVVFNNGAALIKGRVSEADSKALARPSFTPKDLTPMRAKTLWVKAPQMDATTPIGAGIRESEDQGYVIYTTSLDTAFPVVQAVLTGGKIQIGFLLSGKKTEQVMFGTVELSGDEKGQLTSCVQELTK